ncbi:MAG: HEPN domain-containing protein [Planctomycetia bacterium]|nr:HEPN domain-containing protein [Planctomycetia bacterium]
MGLILQILGVVFLLLIAYVAFRVLVLLGKAGIIIYAVKKLVSQTPAGVPGPTEISLVEVGGTRWDDKAAVALASPLPALGFHEVGFFDLDLMGGVRLQAWVRPEEGLYSVIYQNSKAGTWSDMVTKYEDGSSLTYSNSPHGGRLRQRPGHENVYFPGTGTDELYRKMVAERPARPTRRLERSDFRGDFERAYAEDIAWRNSPKNFDPAAVTPVAALAGAIGGRYSESQLGQIRQSMSLKMSWEEAASRLTPFAFLYRYPGVDEEPDEEMALEAIEDAESIVNQVLAFLSGWATPGREQDA